MHSLNFHIAMALLRGLFKMLLGFFSFSFPLVDCIDFSLLSLLPLFKIREQ